MAVGALGGAVAAPAADAARVAAIRNNLDLKDAGEIVAFGERALREVTAGADRLLAEVRGSDLAEAIDLAQRCRDQIAPLDPSELEPRGGLDNVFNGRSARLHRFRKAFDQAASEVQDLEAGIEERRRRIEGRIGTLNGLHEQARTFILELDAYLEAGRLRMADAHALAALAPVEAPGDGAEGAEAETAAAPTARALPDPTAAERLEARLEVLRRARRGALHHLPLVRIAQNAEAFAAEDLALVAAALAEWRQAWTSLLNGGFGRDRARHRPSIPQMAEAKVAVLEALDRVRPSLAEARARRDEAAAAMQAAAETVRRP